MSSSSAPAARKSKGRQKVTMAKMENHSNLQVTFSKRRAGLFKKASELCTLCGAEAAIVVFSPANKVYCFGHPCVKTVVDRLVAGMDPAPTKPRSHLIIEAHRNSTIREHNIELTRVESLLRAERRRAEEIELLRKAGRVEQWLPPSFDDLDLAQLRALEEAVMGFKKSLDARVQKEMFRVSQNENPSVFPLGVGSNNIDSRVPSFDCPRLSLGLSDFSSFYNGEIGPAKSLNSSVGGTPDYVTTYNSSSHGGIMFNVVGGGNAVASVAPNYDHETVGSGGAGFALGHGHGHGLFQMF